MLIIKDLTKHYRGSQKGVDNINMTVEDGDIYGFIGPNGAGKTTTLKCIAGIHSFESGSILLDGVSVKDEPIRFKRMIAYIPDDPDMYDYLTGIQYLNFISDVFGVSKDDRVSRIAKYAEEFELTSSLGDLISAYSHGMKQKLAIIAALVHSPKLFILDEPFVGLDPKASVTLKAIMRDICSQGGAIFFSTHVLDVAEKLCNKVSIIKEGRLIASGRMTDIVSDGSTLESIFMEVAENGSSD